MNRLQLKEKSKQQIKGKIGILLAIAIIVFGLSFLAGIIPVIGAGASMIITPPLVLSIAIIYLKIAKEEPFGVSNVFDGFYDWWSAFKVNFLVGLFTLLWSLLFIIPGIIKSFSYSQAVFILAENPHMSALEAIRKSKEMMDGHKVDLFVLMLSFIGWELLGIITLGIAYIWVYPYMMTAYTNFYLELKKEQGAVNATYSEI